MREGVEEKIFLVPDIVEAEADRPARGHPEAGAHVDDGIAGKALEGVADHVRIIERSVHPAGMSPGRGEGDLVGRAPYRHQRRFPVRYRRLELADRGGQCRIPAGRGVGIGDTPREIDARQDVGALERKFDTACTGSVDILDEGTD